MRNTVIANILAGILMVLAMPTRTIFAQTETAIGTNVAGGKVYSSLTTTTNTKQEPKPQTLGPGEKPKPAPPTPVNKSGTEDIQLSDGEYAYIQGWDDRGRFDNWDGPLKIQWPAQKYPNAQEIAEAKAFGLKVSGGKSEYYVPSVRAFNKYKIAGKNPKTTYLEADAYVWTFVVGSQWRWVFMEAGTKIWIDENERPISVEFCNNPAPVLVTLLAIKIKTDEDLTCKNNKDLTIKGAKSLGFTIDKDGNCIKPEAPKPPLPPPTCRNHPDLTQKAALNLGWTITSDGDCNPPKVDCPECDKPAPPPATCQNYPGVTLEAARSLGWLVQGTTCTQLQPKTPKEKEHFNFCSEHHGFWGKLYDVGMSAGPGIATGALMGRGKWSRIGGAAAGGVGGYLIGEWTDNVCIGGLVGVPIGGATGYFTRSKPKPPKPPTTGGTKTSQPVTSPSDNPPVVAPAPGLTPTVPTSVPAPSTITKVRHIGGN